MFRKAFRYMLSALCAFILLLSFPMGAAANPAHGTITVDTVSAVTGDTVIVPIRIENNPGIMAITISITYDSDALTYEKYYKGYLKDYTVADHPDKNLIRFVSCEIKNRSKNDIMFSLQFKVKENASFDLHPMTIEYKSGDFCNWNLDKLMPEIVPGGVEVAFNGDNCKHKNYSDWEIAANPGCTEPGARQHICQKCGHVESEAIPPVGHEFEEKWTIDQPATAEKTGIMSRHCVRCDAVTDTLTFTLEQAKEQNIQNDVTAEITASPFIEQLIKEQIPEEERQEYKDRIEKQSDGNQSSSNDAIGNFVETIRQNPQTPLAKLLEILPNAERMLKLFSIMLIVFLKILLI